MKTRHSRDAKSMVERPPKFVGFAGFVGLAKFLGFGAQGFRAYRVQGLGHKDREGHRDSKGIILVIT